MEGKRDKKWAKSLSDALNMTTTIVAAIVIGYMGGKWLDAKFNTGQWLSLAGFLLGALTGFKAIWDKMNKAQKTNQRDK